MIAASQPRRLKSTVRFAAGAILAAIVVACGSPTPTPSATPSAPAVPTPTASPTVAPLASIVPVPTSQLVAPGSVAAHLDDAKAKALQTALDGVLTGGKYPGASAAIVFPDGSIWSGVSGSAVLSPKTSLTTDTLFSIGSISKTFVAALIGRLAVAGTIGLDDPLSKYLPDFPNAANISLRQMLNHTSGIRDLFETMDTAILAHPEATWTTDQVIAKIGKPYFDPGTGYHYSNTDFVLLGAVVEKVTGQTVAALVRASFLAPLGLDHTYLQTEETAQGPEAHGYCPGAGPACSYAKTNAASPRDNSAGTMLPFTAEATAVGFAGAYVSTASDIAIWANALYSGNILDMATLASMVDISPTMAFKVKPPYPYGLGFEETTVDGQVAWGHRGNLDGFWSAVEYLPAYHVTVAVFINAQWADPIAASFALAKAALA